MSERHVPGQFDPPVELFGGIAATPEISRNQRLLFIEQAFLPIALGAAGHLRTEGGKRHLQGGFIQRQLMMVTSRVFIREKWLAQRGELDPYLASELDVHLNAFYLNLVGGLDNLAWAVSYEHALQPDIDEDSPRSRSFANLVGERFLAALAHQHGEAARVLRSQEAWVAELKELRDPAAHRLPLRFVTGVITEDIRPQFEALQARAREALERGDLDAHRNIRHQQRTLASFLPVLASPQPDARGMRVIPNIVAADHERFLAVARYVVESVLL